MNDTFKIGDRVRCSPTCRPLYGEIDYMIVEQVDKHRGIKTDALATWFDEHELMLDDRYRPLQNGDIVEVLNFTPEQSQYLDAKLLVGMRYPIGRIFKPGEIGDAANHFYTLRGFPLNTIGYDTYFTASQLLLYCRAEMPDITSDDARAPMSQIPL